MDECIMDQQKLEELSTRLESIENRLARDHRSTTNDLQSVAQKLDWLTTIIRARLENAEDGSQIYTAARHYRTSRSGPHAHRGLGGESEVPGRLRNMGRFTHSMSGDHINRSSEALSFIAPHHGIAQPAAGSAPEK